MKPQAILVTTALLLTAALAQADVYNPASGQSFSTIQAAIDAATAGDTLQISAGTYTESVNVNKTLNLVSWHGRDHHQRKPTGQPDLGPSQRRRDLRPASHQLPA